MATCIFIALTNAVPGRDAAFNEWYDRHHLANVLDCPGITSARRYDVQQFTGNRAQHRYVAVYGVDHPDPVSAVEEVFRRFNEGEMQATDAMADDFVALLCTEQGGRD
ncbi:hypothetical protein E4634_02255 [Mangrovimicrobium sediminis]|uniref:DUF4286 family protein n=1 Tax=Mangrovimicrobium sediminis TaxID=2562682 RepID=A0A4Z0M7Q6_9GAMM|nr:DUF4286 family protein [Haliea sp. SAOS-164]TGD75722.1 hypothetical protein E4634_02255 [Haliea sp. SAOS-164]